MNQKKQYLKFDKYSGAEVVFGGQQLKEKMEILYQYPAHSKIDYGKSIIFWRSCSDKTIEILEVTDD